VFCTRGALHPSWFQGSGQVHCPEPTLRNFVAVALLALLASRSPADCEVMRDLVQDDASHLTAKQLRVVPVEPHERAAIDRDLVRQHRAVVTAASG
jgi:hypothetical protein